MSILNLFHGYLSQCLCYTACCSQHCPKGQFLLFNSCSLSCSSSAVLLSTEFTGHRHVEHLLKQLLVWMPWEDWGNVSMGGGESAFSRIARAFRSQNFLVSVNWSHKYFCTFESWYALWVLGKEIMHSTWEWLCYLHSPCSESFPETSRSFTSWCYSLQL